MSTYDVGTCSPMLRVIRANKWVVGKFQKKIESWKIAEFKKKLKSEAGAV